MAALTFASGLGAGAPATAGEVEARAVVLGRGVVADGPTPWIDGGFGRLTEGGDASGGSQGTLRGKAHLGLDWSPFLTWRLHLHGVVRSEPGAAGGWRAGVVEAYLEYRPVLSTSVALRFRGGVLFPPTSLENTEPLWQSPYTVTLSPLNSWIGEEVRPVGLDAALQLGEPGRTEGELAAMVFGGSDTAGTLLAWRGFALHDRLSVLGEVLPLPPLPTLRPDGAFKAQRRDGTRPIDELDGRAGFEARGRFSWNDTILAQAAWTDNRGDRGLHRGQYAWDARWLSAGAEAALPGGLRLISEVAVGDTGMGPQEAGMPHVDVRFHVGYALLTWASPERTFRLSARYDRFENDDRDGVAEPNGESGWSFLVAGFWRPDPRVRVGVEYLDLRADRPAAAAAGAGLSTDARRVLLELRLEL